MHAGCQQGFQHRVRMDKRVKSFRISLSFRSFLRPGESNPTKPQPLNLASSPVQPLNLAPSPVPSDASFAICDSESGSPNQPNQPGAPLVSPVLVAKFFA